MRSCSLFLVLFLAALVLTIAARIESVTNTNVVSELDAAHSLESTISSGLTSESDTQSETKSAVPSLTFPGKFKLQHPQNGLFVALCGTDLCLRGTPLVFSVDQIDYIASYQNQGYVSIRIVGGSADGKHIRHAGYVLHPSDAVGPQYDFAYLPVIGCNGVAIVFKNPYGNFGYSLGYDATTDKVLIVPNDDVRVVQWNVNDETVDDLYRLQIPEQFELVHPTLQKAVKQCGGDICIKSGSPLTLEFAWPDYSKSFYPFGYNTLKVVGQNDVYLRHAGYLLHAQTLAGPQYDFAYLPEGDCSNQGVYLHNPYGNYGYDLGYDENSDRVLIVPRGDSRTVAWHFVAVKQGSVAAN